MFAITCLAGVGAVLILMGWQSPRLKFARAEMFILKSLIELMRGAIVVIALAMCVLPISELLGYRLAFFVEHRGENAPVARALETIDRLVMALTTVIVSMGLVMLYQPRFVPRLSDVLPGWVSRFTRIETLKSTILTLVTIIVSLGMLEDFVHEKAGTMQSLQRSAAGFLLIIGIAIFIRVALRSKDGATPSDDVNEEVMPPSQARMRPQDSAGSTGSSTMRPRRRSAG